MQFTFNTSIVINRKGFGQCRLIKHTIVFRQGAFSRKGYTFVPKCTFLHCTQGIHCVLLNRCDYHTVAIVRNLQAAFHEYT